MCLTLRVIIRQAPVFSGRKISEEFLPYVCVNMVVNNSRLCYHNNRGSQSTVNCHKFKDYKKISRTMEERYTENSLKTSISQHLYNMAS